MAGGTALVAGVVLPRYGTDASNPRSQVDGRTGSLSAWDVHPILRWHLLAAATAPFVLAWIILRGPGDIAISLKAGFLAALVATVVMIGAAAKRSSESERPRKPPGTI
jgi:hypothetical protein